MKSKEWDGEGMPPIGTVCEYYCTNISNEWRKCEIVAHYHEYVVAIDEGYKEAVLKHPRMLRPIKTPEQIAREERQQAIDEMLSLLHSYSTFKDAMGVLYDAGYRKTEVNK